MPRTLILRTALPTDLPAIDGLLARSYPALLKADYPPSVLVTALPIIARANPALVASGTYYLVADAGGAVLGAGGWSFAAPQGGRADGSTAHVRHVATDPAALRRGVGRMLMAAAVAAARRAGAERLECQSTLMAVPFYAAMGLETLGEITVRLRPGIDFPAVRMQRAL
ncbi:GNAT family N-acetyltransferase [Maritimibacter sp. 55A14]|uniref:GNAT family N-acetyltransferase n=1 Tax=Maritimibacter sp. 55A14 TaxID=2174844 RepID=UPI000D616369|nr:GNAT family N-acetyltransferase [Maritimibacter sp. 55A14]PWE33885.1 GNAT family N-acetyltransferase [Maritimibacter sp. 55A14]